MPIAVTAEPDEASEVIEPRPPPSPLTGAGVQVVPSAEVSTTGPGTPTASQPDAP